MVFLPSQTRCNNVWKASCGKYAALALLKTTKIYSWTGSNSHSSEQLVSRNGLFIWKYQLRLEQFLDAPDCSVIYSKRAAWLREQNPEPVSACWESILWHTQKKTGSPRRQTAQSLFSITPFMGCTKRLLMITSLFCSPVSWRDYRCQLLLH